MTSGNLLFDVVLVAVGAAAGAVVRLLLGWWQTRAIPGGFPWAIWVANVVGSLLAGCVAGMTSTHLFLILGIGFCGALTTMSTFALDVVMLKAEGARRMAAVNVIASVVPALLCAGLGLWLGGLV
jgi:CrcB protein